MTEPDGWGTCRCGHAYRTRASRIEELRNPGMPPRLWQQHVLEVRVGDLESDRRCPGCGGHLLRKFKPDSAAA